jgi:aconitate hydratase
MSKTVAEKILSKYIQSEYVKGKEADLQITHTLIQDSLGTMTALQFEAMDVPRVRTEQSVSFVDHNMLQGDFKNMDDHRYLQSVAAKHGLFFSRPGNGICHQVFLERFAKPGKTLLGADSHSTTAGGAGMIAIGAGGLDVAVAMAGEKYTLNLPEILGVELTGRLQPFVSAKDVILEVLRRIGVKGAIGKILEYTGPGIKTLTVPERATITNMGTETGATTSIFPSDKETRKFLVQQGRGDDWVEVKADPDAEYDELISIALAELEPLIALPHSPGNVKKVSEVEGIKVDQVCVGSCTNSSLKDLKTVAQILKGKRVPDNLSLAVSPGSRQVLLHLLKSGELAHLVESGARILECACGPCVGMGQAPSTDAVSLRTFNRNFLARSGTRSAQVYLVSPETAAVSASTGVITDPRRMGVFPDIEMPDKFIIDDNLIIAPKNEPIETIRGPNIKPLPSFNPLPSRIEGAVLLKLGDNITTGYILPGGAKVLPLRSNIPEISKYAFEDHEPNFWKRARAKGGGVIVAGENYGQGSSREHAALAPKYLGVKAVLAKSYARIHQANLLNFGIVPLIISSGDYENVNQGDVLELDLTDFSNIKALNARHGTSLTISHNLSDLDIKILKEGGRLPYIKSMKG